MTWPEGYYVDKRLLEGPVLTPISDDWGEMDACLRNGWSIWREVPDAPRPWDPSLERALDELLAVRP